MAKYLRMYNSLLPIVKSFYGEEEFITEISKVWGLQKTYEAVKKPKEWPFNDAKTIPWLAEHIKWVKSEGATDEDIMWWWNISPIERILIKGTDFGFRRATMIDSNRQGLKIEDVMKKVLKTFPTYSEEWPNIASMTPNDKQYFLSEDRPLPIELHYRVDIYMAKNQDQNSLLKIQKEKDSFNSANAWIRHLIKNNQI